MTTKPELKPGAYARIEDLQQATDNKAIWTNAWSRLIRECRGLGWTVREIAEAAGITEQAVRDRLNGR